MRKYIFEQLPNLRVVNGMRTLQFVNGELFTDKAEDFEILKSFPYTEVAELAPEVVPIPETVEPEAVPEVAELAPEAPKKTKK